MGLDGVEIAMAVEEDFDIIIDDSEAEKLSTPGKLIDYVMAKVGRTDRAACLTQRAFHRLRSSLMRQFGLKRNQIRTETLLAALFPRQTRKVKLREVLDSLDVHKSVKLFRPTWLKFGISFGVVGAGIAPLLVFRWHQATSPYLLVNFFTNMPELAGVFSAILFGSASVWLTRGLRYEFKLSMKTVANLSRWIVANAPNLVEAPPGQWSREQIAEKIREIVIDHLDCEKDYREDANFVKDLGLS
jgi:acyl carrier protein